MRLSLPADTNYKASTGTLDELHQEVRLKLKVDGEGVTIVWDVISADGTYPFLEGKWAIERSGSPSGPFKMLVTDLPLKSSVYRDASASVGLKSSRYMYYRLLLVTKEITKVYGYDPIRRRITAKGPNGITWGGPGTSLDFSPPQVKEIRNRVDILMLHAGTPALIYRERWDEGACSRCVNPITGTHIKSLTTCLSCYGTGFVGGFYPPMVSTLIRVGPSGNLRVTPLGPVDLKDGERVIMPAWPPIHVKDRVKTLDGSAFSVASSMEFKLHGVPGMLMVTLVELPGNSPVNKLKLPTSALQISIAPRKQLARAMNLDSYARSLSSGSMYFGSFIPPDT